MQQNRLANATSPYLLQHATNPVDWRQWGPDALGEAKAAGKPILLSVGYAACHWCHVMAHESFEDDATAAVMNELFVNIKVDREERPDIDHIYMSALHALGQQGGWPLTMFLTPDAEPFWGGTYFPKTARYGHPAFVDVLRSVARVFHAEPDKVRQNANALRQALTSQGTPAGAQNYSRAFLDDFAATRRRHYRSDAWRHSRRAEIPESLHPRIVVARVAAHRRHPDRRAGDADARSHERGRHL